MTRYFTRWPSASDTHTMEQIRNGSCFIQRKSKTYAQYINGDFMGYASILPNEITEVSRENFKRWAPACMGGRGE